MGTWCLSGLFSQSPQLTDSVRLVAFGKFLRGVSPGVAIGSHYWLVSMKDDRIACIQCSLERLGLFFCVVLGDI